MRHLRIWFCRKRDQLIRGSLLLVVMTPMVAWGAARAFAVDAQSVVVAIAAALFVVWRPYRDSWLRPACSSRTRACV